MERKIAIKSACLCSYTKRICRSPSQRLSVLYINYEIKISQTMICLLYPTFSFYILLN